ncbi:MAG TPA: UDP-glucose/GDP-mannose dehydrogenase family protein [candidate division Zixibacteria bacterium]|nr:UDP-glucose/GDP-mannose dehydrogenase family protein [candidate division Zixibacteria bacterium]
MNICVVGTGYVGLVAGTCLSDFGMNVICVDKDKSKIDMLNDGKVPIYELGLSDMIQRNVKLGRLHFSTDLKAAVDRSLVVFLGVGTPENPDGSANLTYIREVAVDIAETMNDYKVLVIKSTVPVGTAKELRKLIKEHLTRDVEFDIVSNPEFLREGAAVNDFLRPDRVVIGSDSERALAIVRDIYRPLYLLETPIVSTSNETAELIKYAANSLLAVKISFINEIANICDRLGADVYQVAVAVGMDKRIGPKFLHPGPGYGGSCFPKDVKSIIQVAKNVDYDFKIARSVVEVNDQQRRFVVDKSRKLLGDFNGKTVTLLGLSFKPNTDDVREAPALFVAEQMIKEGAVVNAYDPAAMDEAKKNVKNINYFNDSYSACAGSDLCMIMTEWNEFRDLNFEEIKKRMRTHNIYDTRNIYNPKNIRSFGFTYICTGRS